MKIFTVATSPEGYFSMLGESAARWGYEFHVLGWQQEWKGFAWKLELYLEALTRLPVDEPVICVDGYDVVVIAPATEMQEKFTGSDVGMIFSGQRYFPNQKWMQHVADQVMSYDTETTITKKSGDARDYSRPCTGLMIGYAGKLMEMFQRLLELDDEIRINDDQTLLNIYYLRHPDALQIDHTCAMFQNLWRTRGIFYGKITSRDQDAELEIFYDEVIQSKRLRNKVYNTAPCFLHAPFNLNMSLLLKELGLNPPKLNYGKGWSYLRYSIAHHAKRALRLYSPFRN